MVVLEATQVRGAVAALEHAVHGSFQREGLGLEPEAVPEQHGRRKDRPDGVGGVLPGDVRGGAVDGFVEAHGAAQAGGGQQAQRAGQHGGLVAEDVAEEVLRQHHVEIAGPRDEGHGEAVHVGMGDLHRGIGGSQLVHDLAPEARGLQHIGLVHGDQAPPAGGG